MFSDKEIGLSEMNATDNMYPIGMDMAVCLVSDFILHLEWH